MPFSVGPLREAPGSVRRPREWWQEWGRESKRFYCGFYRKGTVNWLRIGEFGQVEAA